VAEGAWAKAAAKHPANTAVMVVYKSLALAVGFLVAPRSVRMLRYSSDAEISRYVARRLDGSNAAVLDKTMEVVFLTKIE
jgi:hypothetical protein